MKMRRMAITDDGGRAETATLTVAGEADGVGDGGGRWMATAAGAGSLNGGGRQRRREDLGDDGRRWR